MAIILITLSLFILTIVCGLLPFRYPSIIKKKQMIAMANSFSGGLFLAVALFHIMPEAEQGFSEGMGWSKLNEKFPLPFFITILTYGLILYIEKIGFNTSELLGSEEEIGHVDLSKAIENVTSQKIQVGHIQSQDPGRKFNLRQSLSGIVAMEPKDGVDEEDVEEEIAEEYFKEMVSANHQVINTLNRLKQRPSLKDRQVSMVLPVVKEDVVKESPNHTENGNGTNGYSNGREKNGNDNKFSSQIDNIEDEKDNKDIKEDVISKDRVDSADTLVRKHSIELPDKINIQPLNQNEGQDKDANLLMPILLLLALSVHSFFEGLAIGVTTSEVSRFNQFLAIILHKWAAALTLGISFAKEGLEFRKSAQFLFAFSLTTPLGILFGLMFAGLGECTRSCFMSISAGTFLYISGSEIIVEEFSITRFRWRKYLAFILGISFITLLKTFECLGILAG